MRHLNILATIFDCSHVVARAVYCGAMARLID